MKHVKLIVAVLVTWKVSGTTLSQCQGTEKPNPMIGFCTQSGVLTRSQEFDNIGSAKDWAKSLNNYENSAIKITDVHVYSEAGAK